MRPSDPRLRAVLAPARRPLTGVVAAGVVGSLLVIVQAWAVTHLVLAALGDGEVARWALVVAGLFATRSAVTWLSDALAARAAAVVGTSLRGRIVAAVLRLRAEGRPAPATGELAVLTTRGVTAAEPYLTRYLPAVVLASVLPVLTLVAIATQDWLSALIVVLTLPLVPLFGALVGLATRDRAAEQWRAMSSLSGHFLDVMRGLPTLVAFRRARAQSGRIAEVTDRYRRASLSTLQVAFASSAVLELVATLSVALVAVTVGVRLAQGELPLETALLVLLLAPEAYWPLRRVGAEFHASAEGIATFEAVDHLTSRADGTDTEVETGALAGPIVIEHLSVVHPGRTTPAIEGLDARVPARGVTVVTGPSGCGKSTLLGALAGLVPVQAGSAHVEGPAGDVLVGGSAWRSSISWLPQRPGFLSGSIADNLRLARPSATDQDLWDALRRVALEERIRDLPGGLDATLGEDGATLSAGERARLALARIVVADRPWVFLDEPTAHLDELTEMVIADTIVDLGRTSGVLVVAHRPALVDLADTVIAMSAPATIPAAPPQSHLETPDHPRATAPVADLTPASFDRRDLTVSSVIGALASASGVALTATAGWLIVQASSQPGVLTLLVAIVAVRTFGLARPVLRYVERLRSHDVALRLLAERRVQVYDAVVPLTPGRLGRHRGDLLASIVDDVDSVVDRELRVRSPLLGFAVVTAIAVTVSALVLPLAGVVVLATCVVSGALGFALARIGGGRAEHDAVRLRGDLSTAVVEVTQLGAELVMWSAEGAAGDRVSAAGRRLVDRMVSAGRWLASSRALVLAVHGVGVGITALVVAPAVASGQVSAPMAALVILVPLAMTDVVLPVADAGALAARTRAAAQRLARLEHTAPAVRDTVAGPLPASSSIRVRDVTAGWDLAESAVRGLTLDLPQGSRVGIVGESGSGKSTVAALLLRFIDPRAGEIRLGGALYPRLTLDDVRSRVGLVDDDPHVFATSLVENVRLARPAATNVEVEAALRKACLGAWLDGLPDGLHTWLGDGHAPVSGGERARIAVARSILAEQPVLVLDEPTAHLDHGTATDLAAEVLLGEPGRTVVWITHDTVGLDLVDQVVELQGSTARAGGDSRRPV